VAVRNSLVRTPRVVRWKGVLKRRRKILAIAVFLIMLLTVAGAVYYDASEVPVEEDMVSAAPNKYQTVVVESVDENRYVAK